MLQLPAVRHNRSQLLLPWVLLFVLHGCDAPTSDSDEQPVAQTPADQESLVESADETNMAPPAKPGAPDEGDRAGGEKLQAVCGVDIVWTFVAEARERHDCPNFPTDESLTALACDDIEWAIFESGCIPPARYLPPERVGRVWSIAGESYRERPRVSPWESSFCSLYFDFETYPDGLGVGRGEPLWERYAAFDEHGDVICTPTAETCRQAKACRKQGRCTPSGTACVAASDEDCERALACPSHGQCTAAEGKCVATRDEDCRASRRCSNCSVSPDGTCAILTDANCEASALCEAEGRCKAVDGQCRAVTDDDCAKSCASKGRCVAENGRCWPGSTEQCRRSLGTEDVVYLGGECVPETSINCSQTDRCTTEFGPEYDLDDPVTDAKATSARDGRWVVKRAGVTWRNFSEQPVVFWPDGTPCAKSSACKTEGHCKKVGEFCEPTPRGCRRSKACKEEGRCSVGPEVDGHRRCVPASDDDCAKSEVCRERGACFFLKPTPSRPLHEGYPACVEKDRIATDCATPMVAIAGECRLPRSFDCAESESCTAFGRGCVTRVIEECNGQPCSEPYVECVNPPDYCAGSVVCQKEGKCGSEPTEGVDSLDDMNRALSCLARRGPDYCEELFGAACTVTDAGCAASEVCERHGHCRPLEGVNTCWPGRGVHCAKSEACRKYGNCGKNDLSTMIECVPTEPIHCQQSEICREEGLCVFDPQTLTCGAPTTADASEDPCSATQGCARYGLCTTDAASGRCVARTRDDCRRSTACDVFGRCSPIDGVCQATAAHDCRESKGCEARGRCVLRHGSCRTEANAAALDATCQNHPLCQDGRCLAATDRTGCEFAGDRACAKMRACSEEGACGWADGACRPTSEEHCEQSRSCKFGGRCGLVDGVCAPTLPTHCEQHRFCGDGEAACTPVDGECGPPDPNPDICLLTRGCEIAGQCALGLVDYHGVACEPARASDCTESRECKTLGKCGLLSVYPSGGSSSEWCEVTRPKHCAQSNLCSEEGRCGAIQRERQRSSESEPLLHCMALEDSHCAGSRACKREGRCRAFRGACVR